MAFRPGEIYISLKTKRRLRWITQIEKERDQIENLTQDQVADRLLNEKIEQEYPNIADLEREFDHAEAELIAKLEAPPAGIRQL